MCPTVNQFKFPHQSTSQTWGKKWVILVCPWIAKVLCSRQEHGEASSQQCRWKVSVKLREVPAFWNSSPNKCAYLLKNLNTWKFSSLLAFLVKGYKSRGFQSLKCAKEATIFWDQLSPFASKVICNNSIPLIWI